MKAKSFFILGLCVASAAFIGNASADPIPEEYKQNGFAIGAQAYTFNRFTVFEAIEKTAQAGGKVIEFFPGQKLSPEEKNVTWNHNASDEVIAKVQTKLKEHGIKAVNYGVVGGRDAAEWRKIFEFGKKLGIYAITTEDATKLDIIEPLVKEFDIRLAIHDHPRRPNNPDYKVWDPHYIMAITKDRDKRIGACADTGHWQSSGMNPVYALRVLKGRVISSHMKDKTDYGNASTDGTRTHDVPYGTGVGEIGRCLDELKKQNFEGNISVEYEHNWENNVPDVTKCIDFVKNHKGAAK
jgi:sugar phosphate isomerase/epimerase